VSSDRKTVVRILWAWNDEKEELWLGEQEKAGWRLARILPWGYTFARSAPADMAYRVDFGPGRRNDRSEYFGLFRDAGWEHVGERGLWQFFRKPVVGAEVPEIFTDTESRIAKYRRLLAFLGVLTAFLASQTALRFGGTPTSGTPTILTIQLLALLGFAYVGVRLLLVINRLKKGQNAGHFRGV
jgi:hypothetical protein